MWHRFDFELRGYQLYSIAKTIAEKFVLLAIDMSLGKTVAVLTALLYLFDKKKIRHVLVVAPKLVATKTWPTEMREWRHLRRLTFAIMVGTPAERLSALKKDVQIHLINKENLQWLWDTVGEDGWFWDVLVIDEASMLKDGRKRTNTGRKGKGSAPLSRFGILSRVRKFTRRVVEMSGTPSPEGVHDMWGLMYALDLGERLGTSKKAFEDRWFTKGYSGYDMKPRDGAQVEIIERCRDLMISLRAEDHIKLPPVIGHPVATRYVDFDPALMREYKKFERELYSAKFDIEAVSRGVLVNKLLQFANGSMYRERGNAIHIHDYKLDALEDILYDLNGEHTLIAWSYKFDKEAMRKRFGKKITFFDEAGKNAIEKWNDGKIRNLATHPGSISHGTNLQYGGHNTIWYGLQHSGEAFRQLNMRLPRPGQPAPQCFVRCILARGTEDEKVIVSQEYKAAEEAMLRDAVKVSKADVDRWLKSR